MDQQAQPNAGAVLYAGFWRRFLALFIDGIILGLISWVLTAMVLPQSIAQWVSALIGWLYFALLESSSSQATLGKTALGMKVTDLSGNRISFGRATGRYFGKIISSLILGIGFIMIAFTAKKQGLHDMLAGTLIVKK